MPRLIGSFCLLAAIVALPIITLAQDTTTDRPSAMKLFPEETVLFIRMANAQEFGDRLRETATGRMLRDPQLQGFVQQLYGNVGKIYADEAEAKVGITWDDLQNLPRGEVAFGVVARPQGRPALMLLVDQGDQRSVADRFVERALELAEARGAEIATEEIEGVEVVVVREPERTNRMVGVFERDNTIVAATDAEVIRGLLHHWNGAGRDEASKSSPTTTRENTNPASAEAHAGATAEDGPEVTPEYVPGRTLAENARFATILRHCRRPQDPPPHLLYFVDPIELVRSVGRNRGGVQFVMGLLPALGLDGLHGVGGTVTFATDQYDDLSHLHVLLENPRAGVLQLATFEPGETAPQPFVPLALEAYVTWNANPRTMYDRIVALVDQYRYEGSVDKFVEERLSDPLGINFVADVIDNLSGRFTWIIAPDRRFTTGGGRLLVGPGGEHVLAAALKDLDAAAVTLETVVKKYADRFEERRFGNVTYYALLPLRSDEIEEGERPSPPVVAIVDGYLFLSGSEQLFEKCIAARDGTVDRLVDSDDYARTMEVLGRETAGSTPVLVSINRAEESIRNWYNLLTSVETRAALQESRNENAFAAALADALDEHQLPPFDVLAPYYAPAGTVLYDTDTGYHAISFTLRNETK